MPNVTTAKETTRQQKRHSPPNIASWRSNVYTTKPPQDLNYPTELQEQPECHVISVRLLFPDPRHCHHSSSQTPTLPGHGFPYFMAPWKDSSQPHPTSPEQSPPSPPPTLTSNASHHQTLSTTKICKFWRYEHTASHPLSSSTYTTNKFKPHYNNQTPPTNTASSEP